MWSRSTRRSHVQPCSAFLPARAGAPVRPRAPRHSSAGCTQDDPTAPGAGGPPAAAIPVRAARRGQDQPLGDQGPDAHRADALAIGVVNNVVYAVGGVTAAAPPSRRCRPTIPPPTPGPRRQACPSPARAERRRRDQRHALRRGRQGRGGGAHADAVRLQPVHQHLDHEGLDAGGGRLRGERGISGKLYVYGDCAIAATFQRYDPSTNTWAKLELPTFKHQFPAGAVVGGKFYLAGGFGESDYSTTVEAYDPGVERLVHQGVHERAARLGAAAVDQRPALRGRRVRGRHYLGLLRGGVQSREPTPGSPGSGCRPSAAGSARRWSTGSCTRSVASGERRQRAHDQRGVYPRATCG